MTNASHDLPLVERLEPAIDAVGAFRRLCDLPHTIFFDSAMRHPKLGRYSYVAADPVDWITAPADASDALGLLADRMSSIAVAKASADSRLDQSLTELPPFRGGWAGLFGYELGRSLEQVSAAAIDEFKIPALAIGLYDVVVAFDHATSQAWIISQGMPEPDSPARRERAADRLAFFRKRLTSANLHSAAATASAASFLPREALATQFAVGANQALTSNFSAAGYLEATRRAIEYIHAGDIFQVNLSQRLLHPATTNAVEFYHRLRERNPAPFAGYLDGGDWQIASASPERFIRVENGHVETRPIKGTRGRSRRPEADLFSADELKASAKDRAENVMIVDLLRNDLSRTCRPESVHVSQLCGLETYEYVQHLVSVVEGTLRDHCLPLDLIRTSFPGGSITGAPKIRAMEIIAELEPTVRGAYCGSLGYIGLDGTMDTSILIRTVTASQGWWQLPVGGAVVAQSNPADEYAETWHKAAGLLRAIGN